MLAAAPSKAGRAPNGTYAGGCQRRSVSQISLSRVIGKSRTRRPVA
jgi:hypothetical protein